MAVDAVGAAAGGLVQDGRNGLVFPAGDARALGARIAGLAGSRKLRQRLGAAGREDAQALTPAAWAQGMRHALLHAQVSRRGPGC